MCSLCCVLIVVLFHEIVTMLLNFFFKVDLRVSVLVDREIWHFPLTLQHSQSLNTTM